MPEIDSTPENIKIPENWKFPERNNPGLKPVQIDNDARFLAFVLPFTRPRSTVMSSSDNTDYEVDYNYLFDREGNMVVKKSQDSSSTPYRVFTNIDGIWGEGRVHYELRRYTNIAPDAFKLDSVFHPIEKETEGYIASVGYSTQGVLTDLSLGNLFQDIREQGEEIRSPKVRFYKGISARGDGFLSPTLEGVELLVEEDRGYNGISRDLLEYENGQTEFIILSEESQKPLFKVEWKVGGGTFVIKQTHLPGRIQKILEAPVRLDRANVFQAAFTSPPYPKDEKGRLIVPWRNIDRIVGASLSHSYPPLTSQK